MLKRDTFDRIAKLTLCPALAIAALVQCVEDTVGGPSDQSPFSTSPEKGVRTFTTGAIPAPITIRITNTGDKTESVALKVDQSSVTCRPSNLSLEPKETEICTLSFDTSSVFFGVTEYLISLNRNGNTVDQVEVDLLKKRTVTYDDKMVYVKAADVGYFMGDSTIASANPRHSARISYDYYMDTVEVTQEMYSGLMSGANPSSFVDASLPVHNVSWYDAVLFCNERSKSAGLDTVFTYSSMNGSRGNGCTLTDVGFSLEKNGYRLPTEAEWEFACRSRENSIYYWGTHAEPEYAWYEANASAPHPGAGKIENVFGLYDMSGNVAEWCLDWYGRYSPCQQKDPVGCTDSWCSYDDVAPDPGCGSKRVFRGGSYDDFGRNINSAVRFSLEPDRSLATLGFRCVRLVPEEDEKE